MSVTLLEPKSQGGGRSRPLSRRKPSLWSKVVPLLSQGYSKDEICLLTKASPAQVQSCVYRYTQLYCQKRKSLKSQTEELALKGKSWQEIVKELGAPAPTIAVYYSKWKNKNGIETETPLDVKTALELEAEDRGISRVELTQKLLSTIVKHELFSDILDTPR